MYWLVALFFFLSFQVFLTSLQGLLHPSEWTQEAVNEKTLEVIAEGDCSSKSGEGF